MPDTSAKHPAHHLLPLGATCAWSGEVIRVWTWEQQMFDGTTKTYECAQRPDGAFILPVLPDGRVLLTHERHPETPEPFYSLPGGKVDWGEDPEQAVVRELYEETGYQAASVRLLKRLDADPRKKMIVSVYIYAALVEDTGRGASEDANEQVQLWLGTPEEAAAIIASRMFRDEGLREILQPWAADAAAMAAALRSIAQPQ